MRSIELFSREATIFVTCVQLLISSGCDPSEDSNSGRGPGSSNGSISGEVATPTSGGLSGQWNSASLQFFGPTTIYPNVCSSVAIALRDSNGGPSTETAQVDFSLTPGVSGAFYGEDSTCATPATQVSIPIGSSFKKFYFKYTGGAASTSIGVSDLLARFPNKSLTLSVASASTGGTMDSSFGTLGNGSVLTLRTGSTQAIEVLIQPDGKTIAVGTASLGSSQSFLVTRFNNDGTPDNSFGSGGIVQTAVNANTEQAMAAGLSGTKVVVAGYTGAVARYNSDGSLDSTFGTGGISQAAVGNGYISSMALQSDGKVLLARNNSTDFIVIRLLANGDLDTLFGSGGTATADISGSDETLGITLQSDGKIVAVGTSSGQSSMARFNASGTLDTSFDLDGKVLTSFGTSFSQAHAIAQQADGKLVVAGEAGPFPTFFSVARYNTNGSLDTSFDSDGKTLISLGGSDRFASAVRIKSDGRIVVGGSLSSPFSFQLAQLNSDGSLDTSFGSGGWITTSLGAQSLILQAMSLQSDGKIVAAGYWGSANPQMAIARYLANGTLDTSFDSDGVLTRFFGISTFTPTDMMILPDGKTLVVGYAPHRSSKDFFLVKFLADGTLDTSFGDQGVVATDTNSQTMRVFLLPDERILVGGNAALARYQANGILDATFNSNGIVTYPSAITKVSDVAMDSNGRIVIVGARSAVDPSTGTDYFKLAAARFNSDGSLDTSFGTGGVAAPRVADFPLSTYGKAVTVQSDGRIVVAGQVNIPNSKTAFIRLNVDGTLDLTFHGTNNGSTFYSVGKDDLPKRLVQTPDGKFLLAVLTVDPTDANSTAFVLRFLSDGTLDSSSSAFALGPPGSKTGTLNNMYVQSSGKITLSGRISGANDAIVIQLNSDLTNNLSFNSLGYRIIDLGSSEDTSYVAVVQNDGKLLVASRRIGPTPGLILSRLWP